MPLKLSVTQLYATPRVPVNVPKFPHYPRNPIRF